MNFQRNRNILVKKRDFYLFKEKCYCGKLDDNSIHYNGINAAHNSQFNLNHLIINKYHIVSYNLEIHFDIVGQNCFEKSTDV